MNIQFTADHGNPSEKQPGDDPKNILLIGNFSGSKPGQEQSRSGEAILNIVRADVLEPEKAMFRLSPISGIRVGDEQIELVFSSMDDFHPDALYRKQPSFVVMQELKQALRDPARAERASQICRQLLGHAPSGAADTVDQPPAPPAKTASEASGDMFSRLLGQAQGASTPAKAATQRLLEQAVGSDLAPKSSRDHELLQDELNKWCEAAMRELLRSPEFRELEANWRSLQLLGEQVEFDEDTALWLVDVGPAKPADWGPELGQVVTRKLAGERVDLIVALHEFSDTSESITDLHALITTAGTLSAPVLSSADPVLAGLPGMRVSRVPPLAIDANDIADVSSPGWQALRLEPGAARVGLGFPRVLLRQPYGSRSDAVDTFDFEELEANPDHEAFVWGNPAIVLAILWLRQMEEPQSSLQVGDLPMVMYDDGSGQAIKPPSELYISDSAAEKIISMGLMPLVGQRGRTGVSLPRLQSIAKPATVLKR
jgi:predicted component of type VI protein secretion system